MLIGVKPGADINLLEKILSFYLSCETGPEPSAAWTVPMVS